MCVSNSRGSGSLSRYSLALKDRPAKAVVGVFARHHAPSSQLFSWATEEEFLSCDRNSSSHISTKSFCVWNPFNRTLSAVSKRKAGAMTIQVTQHVRQVRGKTRAQLMLCDDGHLYVVKFGSSRQHYRQLVAEYIVTQLARWAGLPVPRCSVVDVPRLLIEGTSELATDARCADKIEAGLHFGSRCVGWRTGSLMDMLPEFRLCEVTNLRSFAGALVLDKWCSNTDRRQAVFYRRTGGTQYSAYFIDQGDCFGGATWKFLASARDGLFDRPIVYRDITGWDSFEPFMSRFLTIKPEVVWGIAQSVPSAWSDTHDNSLADLIEILLKRRSSIHELIDCSRAANPQLFPHWVHRAYVSVPAQSWSVLTPIHPEASTG